MTDTSKLSQKRVQRPGFTLVELLVVIGIIVVLMAILLPTAGRVRIQAQTAKTQATMSGISAAIERYYTDHRSYPGVLPNNVISAGFPGPGPAPLGNVTMSENLVLTLCGGFQKVGAGLAISLADIGKGPMNLSASAVRQTRGSAYIEPASLLAPQPWDGADRFGQVNVAMNAFENAGIDAPGGTGVDTLVPEFLDDYSSRRPILYLRAVQNGGTITATDLDPNIPAYNSDALQYNQNHLLPYQRNASGRFEGDFVFVNGDTSRFPSWSRYLSNPSVADSPRGRDRYILISAGADRAYGTRDDIFGG